MPQEIIIWRGGLFSMAHNEQTGCWNKIMEKERCIDNKANQKCHFTT